MRVRYVVIMVSVLIALALSIVPGQITSAEAPETPPGPFAPFAGDWTRRDAELVVSTMLARFRWKTGACTGEFQPEPCDQNILGILVYGGLAEMVLTMQTEDEPLTAHGRVVLTNRYDVFPRGYPVVLTIISENVVTLEQPRPAWDRQQIITLCRPPRDPNSCD